MGAGAAPHEHHVDVRKGCLDRESLTCLLAIASASGLCLMYMQPLKRVWHVFTYYLVVAMQRLLNLLCCVRTLQEIRKFTKVLGMEVTAVFGGTGISNQISELKRGSEVRTTNRVVPCHHTMCAYMTPRRMQCHRY